MRARSVISVSAGEPAPRSTGTMRPLMVSQPKIGIHCSSRLRMNTGLSNSGSSAKVSQADWCLAATMIGPLGIFSQPADFVVDAGDDAQQLEIGARPRISPPR